MGSGLCRTKDLFSRHFSIFASVSSCMTTRHPPPQTILASRSPQPRSQGLRSSVSYLSRHAVLGTAAFPPAAGRRSPFCYPRGPGLLAHTAMLLALTCVKITSLQKPFLTSTVWSASAPQQHAGLRGSAQNLAVLPYRPGALRAGPGVLYVAHGNSSNQFSVNSEQKLMPATNVGSWDKMDWCIEGGGERA